MLRLAFDFIITWRETRTRPNAYLRLGEQPLSPKWNNCFTWVKYQMEWGEGMMRIGSSDAYELPGGNEGLILHSVREHPRSRCISPPAYRLRRFWKTVAREALGNEWVVVMECFYVLCKWVKSDFCCRYVVWAGSWACPYGGTFDGYFGFLKYPLIGWVLFTSLFSYCVLASEWSATQILSQDTFLLHSLVRSPFPFHITGERSGFRFLFFLLSWRK